MNLAHLHLILNHFPIIGTIIGLSLLLGSLAGKNDDLRRASLIIFAAIAILTLPTFFSGVGAQGAIRTMPGVSEALIDRHEGAAELALGFMVLTGTFALIALWQRQKHSDAARWDSSLSAVLVLAIMTTGVMARVGTTGGEIRHPEIGLISAGATGTEESGISQIVHAFEPSPAQFTDLMVANKYWWAFIMDLHFMGLALLIGTIGLLDLRMLGFAKQLPVASLHRLAPWGLAGFGVNLLTGVLAFIGMPAYYTYNIAFWLKIWTLVLLGVNALAFYLTDAFRSVKGVGPGEDAPLLAKVIAGSSLLLWIAVIALGRYIQSYPNTISVR